MAADKQHDATTDFNDALKTAFADGAFDNLAGFYTEDTIVLPPRGRVLEGRGSVPAFWRGVRSRFAGMVFTTETVKDLGDAAKRETGAYTTAPLEAAGNAPEGKYVFVWQLVDGEWQIESSIWNRSAAAGQGQGRPAQGQGRRQGGGQAGGQRRQGTGGGGGQGGGYRQRSGTRQGNQGGGYRQGGDDGGYRQGATRPSFQGGGGGIGGGGGRRQGGGQGGGQRRGQGEGSPYEQSSGLYSDLKE